MAGNGGAIQNCGARTPKTMSGSCHEEDHSGRGQTEPLYGQALTVVRALSDPGDEEEPLLIGFLMLGHSLLHLYVQRPDHRGAIGVDVRLTDTTTALIASLPSLIEEAQHQKPSPDDPHCDLLVDLTNW
ncbi:hypothetical protein [Streptomyces sp. NPDC056948]|uniref:hypothetical protein n=1 Tax=Streptomyces sp. NPDC056948 TaxID=3345975 RepID=UPI003634EAAD